MNATWELALAAGGVALALAFRPWRMCTPDLLHPAFAILILLPLLWLLPQRLPASAVVDGLPLQLSGAGLALLMLGWPLAVLALAGVGLVVAMGSGQAAAALHQYLWVGLLPCTLAVAWGALLRRFLPPHVFVYILGRGFFGTALALTLSAGLHGGLWALSGDAAAPVEGVGVARWLMAWGDAFLTGLLVAVFVAFRPQWLATWSDRRYLRPPASPPAPPPW
jgi:uncharacterized membrane protein